MSSCPSYYKQCIVVCLLLLIITLACHADEAVSDPGPSSGDTGTAIQSGDTGSSSSLSLSPADTGLFSGDSRVSLSSPSTDTPSGDNTGFPPSGTGTGTGSGLETGSSEFCEISPGLITPGSFIPSSNAGSLEGGGVSAGESSATGGEELDDQYPGNVGTESTDGSAGDNESDNDGSSALEESTDEGKDVDGDGTGIDDGLENGLEEGDNDESAVEGSELQTTETGTSSPEILAEYADTTMVAAEIPEISGETVTDQLTSLCGETRETGYWGDPIIDWNSHVLGVASTGDQATDPNYAFDELNGFGWNDNGTTDDLTDDFYQIGTTLGFYNPGTWGNFFSIATDITTTASYAIRIYTTDIKIDGNGHTVQSSDYGISIEQPEGVIQTGDGITIVNTNFAGPTGITGTLRNGINGGDITMTDCNFNNDVTYTSVGITANGLTDYGSDLPGGTGGTITIEGKETIIGGQISLSAEGGRGNDGGTITVNVKTIDGAERYISANGGDGGAGSTGGAGGTIILASDSYIHKGVYSVKGGKGGDGIDGGTGGAGGDGGTLQIWAASIGSETAPIETGFDTEDPIVMADDITRIFADGGDGGVGGAVSSGTGGTGGDGGTGGRIDMVFGSPGSITNIEASANGGTGGVGGHGGASGAGGNGGDGGAGGSLYLWADTINSVTLSTNGGVGGDGGGGAISGLQGDGGDSPRETLYVGATAVTGSLDAYANGGAGSNPGDAGRIYSTLSVGDFNTIQTNNGIGVNTGEQLFNQAAIAAPVRPAFPGDPAGGPGAATVTSPPSIALKDNSDLSPMDRILDYIAQLQALGFTIDEADLFSVLVPEIPYYVIPALDPDGVSLWLIFTDDGALVSPVPGIDTGNEPLDPDLLSRITALAQFVQKVNLIQPSDLLDLMLVIDENLTRIGTQIVSMLQDLGYDDAAGFITRILENPADRDLVAGWPCPFGYTKEERLEQFKEDYMKNYLVIMETLLSKKIDPASPEPDTGVGGLTAWAATIIKYIQNSRVALEENYNTLLAHAEGAPWNYREMEVYLDNEAAYTPVEADLAALESLSGVDGGLPKAGGDIIITADLTGIPGLMQLISTGRFPDDAFTLASAAFEDGITRYDLSGYVMERCPDYGV